ncbi:MAG: bifunctional homocysteine S-methyltransferase/methylenetetrahydrofolate reductase [Christensenellales bacterium]|nr:bifunctional homocysteine S-methyltransferase/methylenetetrahydrofolate reductase [Christensenellales bacterium]
MEYRDSARVRELLAQGVLLFDGATGTALCAQSGEGEAVERLCLTQPQRVLALHRAYLAAGCKAIKTNTFAAHVSLACENKDDQKTLIRAAYDLARRAGDAYDAAVFADIGPAPTDADSAAACYIAMAEQYLNVGATCFLFETMQSGEGLAEAAAYIKASCPDAWIMVSFAADADGFTRAGEQASALALQMSACGAVDAIGLNCICGAYHIRQLLSTLDVGDKWMSAMPNAGYPHVEEGRTYYDSAPAYYAQQVMECVKTGARIVGGCCGTTPEHIRQIARLLGTPMPPRVRMGDEKAAQPPEKGCRSRILRRLEQGRRITLVELDPPRSADIGGFMEGARQLEQAGADAITIADCPIGRARMDSSLLACKLSRELGIEALPHMTCRDRNVNATKALLLGLSMENVHNVLAVTGDPIPTGDRGSVKSVYQFNSRVLAKFIRGLGESGEAEPFFVCGGLNINAVRFDSELDRAKEKMDCGVSAFLTQPVLSEQAALHLERARDELRGAKLIGGLFPVVSEKNARFLQSEVHGITVDEAVVRAYAGLDRAQGEDMAVRLCREAASRISPFVDGYYMMTPFQRVELVCRVIRATRNLAE